MQQEIWFQKYKILGLLGRGGTAKVYLAEHIILNSYRAIKFIPKNHPLYELQRNEASVLKNLKHSGIPIIYDIEENEEGSYIVEQYLEGQTLKEYVASRGSLREDILLDFGIQLCGLIHYLHSLEQPILYVDLKPDNIILSDMTLKLIDFGSAVLTEAATGRPEYCATVGYAAPELYSGTKVDGRCDVFGIGMLLYYMATGCYIGSGSSTVPNIDLVGSCSGQLKHIINRCLKSDPAGRYASVARLDQQLSALLKKSQFEKESRFKRESCLERESGLKKGGQSQKESPRAIKIAVAGTQPRIGVTHLAFRLCNYYFGKGVPCLYQEVNRSGCVIALKRRYGKVDVEDGVRIINKIPMYAYGPEAYDKLGHYPVIVQDFGSLTEENLEEYLSADQKLLILGTKDWELDHSESVLKLVTEYKEIFYLFNFTDGGRFRQVLKNMAFKDSYRIPYEPEPFAPVKAEQELELFREILPLGRRLPWYTRAYNFIRGGRR